ncbi:MAG: hypothetical protein A2Y60_04835 [Chloroflexi bacterium RBG_13_54_9]|nr:MAG: hypothetical protein A2Y60_04835 [Chloroflexi bacterium RBG_13_54_9]
MNHEEKKRFIAERFPQLQLVTKSQWADAACEVWAKVWEMSSWEDLDTVPANPLTPSASLLNHVRAVVDNCIQVAKVREAVHGDKVDMDVLIVAGVLHDTSKVLEYEWRDGQEVVSRLGELYQHGFYAAHMTLEAGFPIEVVHIVLTHTHATRAYPKTLEGILLFYCDMVDADLNRLRDHGPLLLSTHK